jgi:hypothetical protein
MLNAIKRTVKSSVDVLSDTHLVTSLGVRMRKPIDKNGMWIGWTDVEVAEHFNSVNKYTTINTPHKEEKEVLKENTHKGYSGGCGRS